jgi:Transposase DDE domain group 1
VGEQQNQPFQLSFNPSLKVDFQGSRVTSDGGLLLVRELDERLGLSQLIAEHLTDSRGKNTQLPMADLLRQAVYSRLAGYEDVNDAERLAQDPTFRLMGSERIWERGAALTSRVQSFETELLTQKGTSPAWPRSTGTWLGGSDRFAAARGARHGQHGNPGLWPAGAELLQRALRIDMLSPAAAIQW